MPSDNEPSPRSLRGYYTDQIEMEEHLFSARPLKNKALAYAIQRYCRGLILRAVCSGSQAVDKLELRLTLNINGHEHYDMDDPALLFQSLVYISDASSLGLDIRCRGTCGSFIISDSGDQADLLTAEEGGWKGCGLYSLLQEAPPVRKLSYRLRGKDLESGALLSAEISDSSDFQSIQ